MLVLGSFSFAENVVITSIQPLYSLTSYLTKGTDIKVYTPNKQLTRAKITEYPTKPFIDFDKFFAAAAGIKSKASTSIDPIYLY